MKHQHIDGLQAMKALYGNSQHKRILTQLPDGLFTKQEYMNVVAKLGMSYEYGQSLIEELKQARHLKIDKNGLFQKV